MRVAYFVSRFPTVSETFVLRELDAVAQELEVELHALFPAPREEVVHPAARAWVPQRPGARGGTGRAGVVARAPAAPDALGAGHRDRRVRERAARVAARAGDRAPGHRPRAHPARRPRPRALRDLSGAGGVGGVEADRHALQLHGPCPRPLHPPGDARTQGSGRGVRDRHLRVQPALPARARGRDRPRRALRGRPGALPVPRRGRRARRRAWSASPRSSSRRATPCCCARSPRSPAFSSTSWATARNAPRSRPRPRDSG